MSWNGQIKEYFLDAAGYADQGFAEISANFDDWPEWFNNPAAASSFNDALRVGLNALGYGSTMGDFDEIAQEFSSLESNFGAASNSLNRMLREWADDQVSGVLREHFDDINENFETIPLLLGSPPRVSINTALRRALTSTMTPATRMDVLNTLFDRETRAFGGVDAAFAIGAHEAEVFTGTTFGDATWADFDEVGAWFERISDTFQGGERSGNVTTFDREDRRFEMVN